MTFGCQGCSTRWTGLLTAHCSVCHRTFTGLAAFDRHRYHGRCRIEGIGADGLPWRLEPVKERGTVCYRIPTPQVRVDVP